MTRAAAIAKLRSGAVLDREDAEALGLSVELIQTKHGRLRIEVTHDGVFVARAQSDLWTDVDDAVTIYAQQRFAPELEEPK